MSAELDCRANTGQHTIRSNIQNLSGSIQKFHNESSHKYQGPKLKKLRQFCSPIFLFGCFSCFLFSLIVSAELDCPEEDEEGWCGLALQALTGTTGCDLDFKFEFEFNWFWYLFLDLKRESLDLDSLSLFSASSNWKIWKIFNIQIITVVSIN